MTASIVDRTRLAVRLIVVARLGAGLVALLAPQAVLGVLHKGIDNTSDIPTRLFGIREIGYGLLLAVARGGFRRTTLGVGVVTDLADAYIGATTLRREGPTAPHCIITAAALAAALLGIAALAPHKTEQCA